MKHRHRYETLGYNTCMDGVAPLYTAAMSLSRPINKMHRGVGRCERPGDIWASDLPRAKLLIVQREQLIEVSKNMWL